MRSAHRLRLIRDRGGFVRAGVRRPEGASDRRNWVKVFADDPQHAIPGLGTDEARAVGDRAAQARGDQAEGGARLLKKAAAYFAKDFDVKFGFIAKHRGTNLRFENKIKII